MVLLEPGNRKQFVVEVDAFNTGVGSVLSQRSVNDNKLHPCSSFLHCLIPAEAKYVIKLLAIKLALEK